MNELTQTDPCSGSLDLVIGWLGGKDAEKVEKATSILRRLGRQVIEFLILEATKPGKRSQHRIAILDVVQKIGGPVGVDELFGLQTLYQHADPNVRAKAEQVIMSLSPGGVPDSSEDAAVMRAFNPFLAIPPRCRPRRTRTSDFAAALRGDQAAGRRLRKSNAAWQKREERECGRDS
jgi:hypothetical protein